MALSSIARQWKLESEAASLGVKRLRERTLQQEQAGYMSGTLVGRKLIQQQIIAIAAVIRARRSRLTQGKAQVGATRCIA